MSAGHSTPVSRWALPAGHSSHRTSTPAVGRFRQTRHATDSHSHWSQELCCFQSWDLEQFTSGTASVDTVHGHLCTMPESASLLHHWMTCACSAFDFTWGCTAYKYYYYYHLTAALVTKQCNLVLVKGQSYGVARYITTGLVKGNGCLSLVLWLTSPTGWLPRDPEDQLWLQCSAPRMKLLFKPPLLPDGDILLFVCLFVCLCVCLSVCLSPDISRVYFIGHSCH